MKLSSILFFIGLFLNKVVILDRSRFYFIFHDFVNHLIAMFDFMSSSCYDILFFIILLQHFICV